MENFRLRMRWNAKRGRSIQLHLVANAAGRSWAPLPTYPRVLGTSAKLETVQWLQAVAQQNDLAPNADCLLEREDGMRLALAFASARYLTTIAVREAFRRRLEAFPSEIILYWFTLCFYGVRQAAGRAALRALLTHEEP